MFRGLCEVTMASRQSSLSAPKIGSEDRKSPELDFSRLSKVLLYDMK